MAFTLATWNINSVRLRESLVLRLMEEHAPDVICLQECKSPAELVPTEGFEALGYAHRVVRGEKGYNGVAILSRIPIVESGHRDFCGRGDTRHVSAALESGVTVHNFYVPAGGDVPDRKVNEKFGHKLDFLDEMRKWFASDMPRRSILAGDLNIAPLEDDVWSHKSLLKIVSHTPVEVERLEGVRESGGWVDVVRERIPEGKLYTWWSYRSPDWDAADKGRRLDHVWATGDLAPSVSECVVLREARGWEQPSDHAPVIVTVEGLG